MAIIGNFNNIPILRTSKVGLYLDGGEHGEILMPFKYVPLKYDIGDIVRVFIYADSEDRLVATTEEPYAVAGDLAYMKVISVNDTGAFLDWGLQKDLLVPFNEQASRMVEGNSYVVKVFVDDTGLRIAASSKLKDFIEQDIEGLEEGEKVDIVVTEETELGFKAVINNKAWGFIYKNEVYENIDPGMKFDAWIKKIRPDNKIDLTIIQPGYEKIDAFSDKIYEYLKTHNGYCALNDKSTPDRIYYLFEMSKKNFKKAVGTLYKQKLITIEDEGIRLNEV